MNNNSIIVISNREDISASIIAKIRLFRNSDKIKSLTYDACLSELNSYKPELIILHCSNPSQTDMIGRIREIKHLSNVTIIFVTDRLVEDVLINAFDKGIDDFFFLTDTDSVILMRIFSALKRNMVQKNLDLNKEILIYSEILDKKTEIYTKESAPVVLSTFFDKSLEEKSTDTIFMHITLISKKNQKLYRDEIAKKIKAVLRGDDIIAYGKDESFYIILYMADKETAKNVVERLNKEFSTKYKIFANATEIKKPFAQTEPILHQSLKNQINLNEPFNFIKDIEDIEIPELVKIRDENAKNFNQFQADFSKNIENIIAPVFYQMQMKYSSRLKEAEINFYINNSENKFSIKKGNIVNELIITYPTFINVIVEINQQSEANRPLSRRLTLELEEFTDEKLSQLIENMIKDFIETDSVNLITNKTYETE